jgi:CHAT domain-containing protein
LPFDLVVLSACASGEGLLVTGQALHGLVSTALDAGARGVLASRWRVDDAAIVPHMNAFYRALLDGDDVVSALHRVRMSAMRGGVSPALWANLEYFGDPTLRVSLERRTEARSMWARWSGALFGWLR